MRWTLKTTPTYPVASLPEAISEMVERLADPKVRSHPHVVVDSELRPLAAIVDMETFARLADLDPDDARSV
jgi:hypothetical protein